MALLSTLRYGSTINQSPASGNYGGDLHLFFTKLNAADLLQQPQPSWATWEIADTYALPNGSVTLDLNVVPDGGAPLFLVTIGAISIRTSDGKTLGGMEIGRGGGLFAPNAPVTTLFNGSQSGEVDSVAFTVGFELMVPWDGVSADCHGSWWAIWH
jgi:hypothetical protein